ncbi:chromosome partitioning protein ParB, partial [Escherichia coli]|nr:chromosome partitioning protein ParB [Escherichia coli]
MDIWCISPLIDSTQALQALRNQVARELAECCGIDGKIFPDNNVDDADYKLSAITTAPDVYSQTQARACRALLMTLNGVPLTAD